MPIMDEVSSEGLGSDLSSENAHPVPSSAPQFEASQAIRALADPGRSRVPIVAVSASALPSDVDWSLAAGMDVHLSKPIDSATLASCVLHWMMARPD